MQSNTIGTSSVAIGSDSLNANINGDSNIAVGRGVLQFNTSGSNNNSIGRNSLNLNISGNENSAFGSSALSSSLTANQNSAFGFNALLLTTTGANDAFGWQSLRQQTTGNFNAGFGTASLRDNTTGSRNAAFGFESGRYIANKSTAATILNNSIMIGWRTSPLANNETNQIVIGYDTTGLGSNTTVLGNASTVTTAIYGDLLLGTTTTSATKLTVSGTETASSAIARGGLINTTLVAAANNDVLVGLDINPTFTNGAFTGVTNYGLRVQSGSSYFSNNIIVNSYSTYAGGGIRTFSGASSKLQIIAGATGIDFNRNDNLLGFMSLFSTGNFGINVSSDAGFRLDVNGTARVQNKLSVIYSDNANNGGILVQNINTSTTSLCGWNFADSAGNLVVEQLYYPSNFFSATFANSVAFNSMGQQKLGFTANSRSVGSVAQDIYFSTLGSNTTYQLLIKGNGSILVNTNTDVASSILTINSTTKGVLFPRMTTTQKNAISSPATGLQVYDTTLNQMSYYNGTTWTNI